MWAVLAYVVPIALAGQDLWPSSWDQWPKWALVILLTGLGVALPQRMKAIGEGQALDELRDALKAAQTLAEDVVDTATSGLQPLAVALEEVAMAGRRADIDIAVGRLEPAALVAAKTLAPRGDDESEGVRACLYMWSEPEQGFVLRGTPRGRSDQPRHKFALADVREHEGFRRMFVQNVPQIDSPVGHPAATILGNPNARYKSFVSAAILDGSGRKVYGFITVDHTDEGRMDTNDGRLLQTICRMLAAGLAKSSAATPTTIPRLLGEECNTQDVSPSAQADLISRRGEGT